jgi:cytochrome c oxidase subunit 2
MKKSVNKAVNLNKRQLCLGLVAGLGVVAMRGAFSAQDARPVIKVEARKFAYTPNEIVLKKGQAVVLEFTAIDFAHGFNVPGLKVRVDLVPGKLVRVELHPTKAGTFPFLCDNFCGDGHEGMSGKLVVR